MDVDNTVAVSAAESVTVRRMLSVDVVVNRAVWITWAVSYRVVVVL